MSGFLSRIRLRAQARADHRTARRALRHIDGTNAGPHLEIHIRVVGNGWDGPGDAIGVTGIKTVVPLDRRGIRYLTGTARRMRVACVEGIARDIRKEREEA